MVFCGVIDWRSQKEQATDNIDIIRMQACTRSFLNRPPSDSFTLSMMFEAENYARFLPIIYADIRGGSIKDF